ncbi:MAG: efflux RND transporter periplasmic adaptor subunit [Phycisphaerales bacterium]|nr:efflux RND transporter periplasmic adaptor subunit [Phycisphaerales bacterium]
MGKAVIVVGGLVVAAGLLAGGGYALTQTDAGAKLREKFQHKAPSTTVRVEPVRRNTITRTISAPGVVDPRRKVEISAQVSARIIALPVDEGGRVKPGMWSCVWTPRTSRRAWRRPRRG